MKITTITLSPAWDITYHTAELTGEGLHRAISYTGKAGGKGINVSRAILKAGGNSIAEAYLCGSVGRQIADCLEKEGVPLSAVWGDGETRTNISVIAEDGKSMEINAPGTPFSKEAMREIYRRCALAKKGDVFCLCGSLPKDCHKSFYQMLCGILLGKGAYVVLDCDGDSLEYALKSDVPPSLIKPNREEFAKLAGKKMEKDKDIPAIAAEVCDLKKTAVLCTLGKDGAIYIDSEKVISVPAVKVEKRICEKGAGDTYLGTFLCYRFQKNADIQTAMQEAAAAAAALVASR